MFRILLILSEFPFFSVHWDADAFNAGKALRFLVAGIGVPGDADARIVG